MKKLIVGFILGLILGTALIFCLPAKEGHPEAMLAVYKEDRGCQAAEYAGALIGAGCAMEITVKVLDGKLDIEEARDEIISCIVKTLEDESAPKTDL